MSGPVRQIVGKDRRERPFIVPEFWDKDRYFLIGSVELGQVVIEGDPFGAYLNDGRAVVWVWRWCGTLRHDEKSIRVITSRPHPAEVYFYADNDKEEWICRPFAELSLEKVKAGGYMGEFSIGRAIALSNRSLAGIKDDIGGLIAWARER
jgi:hypothetical protein